MYHILPHFMLLSSSLFRFSASLRYTFEYIFAIEHKYLSYLANYRKISLKKFIFVRRFIHHSLKPLNAR